MNFYPQRDCGFLKKSYENSIKKLQQLLLTTEKIKTQNNNFTVANLTK